MTMASSDLNAALGMAGRSLGHAMLALAGGLVVIALIDVPAQWFQRNKKLMMTKQEVKDEMRQSDGAPELKQQQRQRAHEILSGSARKAVSEATVILTNPTHFRSEEHTSELQSLMRISYAVFCLKKQT